MIEARIFQDVYRIQLDAIERLEDRIEILKDALAFYADSDNWTQDCTGGDLDGMGVIGIDPPIWNDNGKRARDALTKVTK